MFLKFNNFKKYKLKLNKKLNKKYEQEKLNEMKKTIKLKKNTNKYWKNINK